MSSMRTWRVATLFAVIMAVGIVLVVVSTSSSGNSTNQDKSSTATTTTPHVAGSSSGDSLAVLDVRVVQASTDAQAKEICRAFSSHYVWTTAGENLNTTTTTNSSSSSHTAYSYLCIQQVHVELLHDAATSISPTVLESITVWSGTSRRCPPPLREISSRHAQVVLCVQTTTSDVATMSSGKYMSDITSSHVKDLYQDIPGWTTVALAPALPGDTPATDNATPPPMFIHYKRPF